MREFPESDCVPNLRANSSRMRLGPAGVQYGADGDHYYCINAYSGGDLVIATEKWAKTSVDTGLDFTLEGSVDIRGHDC
jgi:hypothetical protein